MSKFPTPPYDPAMVRRFPEAERKEIKFSWSDNNAANMDERGRPIEHDTKHGETEWGDLVNSHAIENVMLD